MQVKSLLLLLCFAALWLPVSAGSGGPDTFGYTWRDSDEANGPGYQWIDIRQRSGTLEILGLGDDNSVGPINFGWDFHYYWLDVDEITFGSNGWIGFEEEGEATSISQCFPAIPVAGGVADNFVAPLLSDLNFASNNVNFPNPGTAYIWSNFVDSLIIQYQEVPLWQDDTINWVGSNTFQLILSGVDSSITFQYQNLSPSAFNDVATCETDLVIGLENVTGDMGLEVSRESFPANNSAIKFYYPATPLVQVADAAPIWNNDPSNTGRFYFRSDTIDFMASVSNLGNGNFADPVQIKGALQDDLLQSLWQDSVDLNNFSAGSDRTINFPSNYVAKTPGQYYFSVRSNSGQDQNATNDINYTEVNVADCLNDTFQLSYASDGPPTSFFVWGGGGAMDGVGTYIEPPAYPLTFQAIDCWIIGDNDPNNGASGGYHLKVYDDNGVPGTLLDSVFVPRSVVQEGAWNRTLLNNPLTVTNGGILVAWTQENDSISLGTENIGPVSRWGFEIVGGLWTDFRFADEEDFLIRLFGEGCGVHVPVGQEKALENIGFKVYPNPTAGAVNLSVDLPRGGPLQWNLYNNFGQLVFQKSVLATPGQNSFSEQLPLLPAGIYFLQLQFEEQRLQQRLVITGK